MNSQKQIFIELIAQISLFGVWTYISFIVESYLAIRWVILLSVVFILGNRSQLIYLRDKIQDRIYNKLMVPLSTHLYAHYLDTLPPNTSIIDVGMGNAISLINNKETVRRKNIHIMGCDVVQPTVLIGEENIKRAKLDDLVSIKLQDMFELETDEKFDSIVYTCSWPLIEKPREMVIHSQRYLKPGGKIAILVYLEEKKSKFKNFVKPHLIHFLGKMNDYGRVTTVKEMDEFCAKNFVYHEIKPALRHKVPMWGECKAYMVDIQC